METLRKLKKRFIQKKSRTSSQKKATGEGNESEIKTPERPTLVDKCRSSESDVFAKKQQEQQKRSPDGATFRNRGQTMSCDSYFARDAATRPYMKDRVLTENAKDLSPEQWLALEMDIFKPLDFYEILFDRMKAKDKAEADRVRSSWSLIIIEPIRTFDFALTKIAWYFDWLFVSDELNTRFEVCMNICLFYYRQSLRDTKCKHRVLNF